MASLLDTPAAREWVEAARRRHSQGVFGQIVSAVIWSDVRGADGELLVPVDPVALARKINDSPHILLHGHDPGRPKGQVLEAALFETASGEQFVAAILGYYAEGDVLDFSKLDVDPAESVPPPARLPVLPEGGWIQVATDPREVDTAWLASISQDAPLPIRQTDLSHNAADATHELIRIGLIYLAVVWAPFITSIASEAGKDTYAGIHKWVRKLLGRLSDRDNPVLDIHTHQDGCQVSFLFRGKDVKVHYAAHDLLPAAAAQAAALIAKLKHRGLPPRQLVYEFNSGASIWYPSYVVLHDNRIITDNTALIAIEQLPTSLSLGLSRGDVLTPVVRSIAEETEE